MKYLLGFLLGMGLMVTPDLIRLMDDHVTGTYQKEACKGLEKNKCYFNLNGWYDKYLEDHPYLSKYSGYLILGESPIYYVVSGRCSNKIMYNPSATKSSGKITMRNYFFSRCSRAMSELSDLIFQDADQEQLFDPDMETF